MDTYLERLWVIGGIPPDQWGDSRVKHKETYYPHLLERIIAETYIQCGIFFSMHLADDTKSPFVVDWVLAESLANAVEHGNRYNASAYIEVFASISRIQSETGILIIAKIQVADEGEYFNPRDIPDPTEGDASDPNSNLQKVGGRGARGFIEICRKFYQVPGVYSVDSGAKPRNANKGKSVIFQWHIHQSDQTM